MDFFVSSTCLIARVGWIEPDKALLSSSPEAQTHKA
jgi:hypothetical protein